MSGPADDRSLDAAVAAATRSLEEGGIPAPRALFLLGTGGGLLPLRLEGACRASLAEVGGIPEAWRRGALHAGALGDLPCWMLEDAPGPPERGSLPAADDPPWIRGFPCWLAAAAGASVLVHASAGTSLVPRIGPGTLAVLADHLNLSGRTPLAGLAGSTLGPLFPDVSHLHDAELRTRALAIGRAIGVPTAEAVAVCTPGPALDTPAERRFFARAGADVAVPGLEGPLLAAAHAGLAVLGLVAVTDTGEGEADLGAIVAAAERIAPGLEDLLARIAPEVLRVADEREVVE